MSLWLKGDGHRGLLTPHILWLPNSSPKLCPQGLCTLCFLCQETHVHDSTPRFLQILHDPFSVVPSLTLTPRDKASFPHHPPPSFSALLSWVSLSSIKHTGVCRLCPAPGQCLPHICDPFSALVYTQRLRASTSC